MKTIFAFLVVLAIVSCSKNEKTDTALSASDAAAVAGMLQETDSLYQASAQLRAATTPQQIHHLDSVFHHHDTLYWHHHNQYNENNPHPHNDHHHQWVPYDHSVDHSHHYHHPYEGHANDSLIVVSNGHHPDYTTHHPDIHDLHDHHVTDSLHHLHQTYHQ